MKKLWMLFWTFAKIGAITFGGGLTMLPLLTREIVEKKKWATEDELLDYYAIGQCTPGIIAVNTATFIGYFQAGVWGGIFATLGMVAPSIVIILTIAAVLQGFLSFTVVAYALMGIRAVVCALLANTVITLGKKSLVDGWCVAIFVMVLALCLLGDFGIIPSVSSVLIVILAAILGIVLTKLKDRRQRK